MSKENPSLESLLSTFDKTENLRTETEALKPRLENEISAALASGDALNEKTATALQTKRGQLELVPAKLEQISARRDELLAKIEPEFQSRFTDFQKQISAVQSIIRNRVLEALIPLMVDSAAAESFASMIVPRAKLTGEVEGLISNVRFAVSQRNIIEACRILLRSEDEFEVIRLREFEQPISQSKP